jgi:DNA-binding transcriptional LysR family regulator
LVDGSSDHLISDLANSALDVAFVAGSAHRWDNKSLSVWSERVVVALPEDHPLSSREVVHWSELQRESLLLAQRGPGPEFLNLLVSKLRCSAPCRFLRHDVALDRLLTLVGASWGILLALEGATGAAYPGAFSSGGARYRRSDAPRFPRMTRTGKPGWMVKVGWMLS